MGRLWIETLASSLCQSPLPPERGGVSTVKEILMNLLYLSDVFCPWCYGFGSVMRRILAECPDLPVRVLGGDLMDEPLTLSEMKEEHPSIREFFASLEATTGQPVDTFLGILDGAGSGGPDWRMCSPEIGLRWLR